MPYMLIKSNAEQLEAFALQKRVWIRFHILSPANKPSLPLKDSWNPNAGLKKLNLKNIIL